MRILLRILLTLVGIVAFFGMLGSAAFWAYGQYGVPMVETQIDNAEEEIATGIEEDYPGADVTVDFQEYYYKLEGMSFYVAIKVNAIGELGGIEVTNQTNYAVIDVVSAIAGSAQLETYEESEWATMEGSYSTAPGILFDAAAAKQTGITYFAISAAAFVGSIVVKAVFLRRKRH